MHRKEEEEEARSGGANGDTLPDLRRQVEAESQRGEPIRVAQGPQDCSTTRVRSGRRGRSAPSARDDA
jgi:hypothetical protein